MSNTIKQKHIALIVVLLFLLFLKPVYCGMKVKLACAAITDDLEFNQEKRVFRV